MRKIGFSLVIAMALLSALASADVCKPPIQTLSVNGGTTTTTDIGGGCSVSVKDNLKDGLGMVADGSNVKITAPNRDIKNSFGKVTIACSGKPPCDKTLVVSSAEYHPTPAPTTQQPVTQPPVVGACSWGPIVLSARVGSSVVSSLSNEALSKCAITNFDTKSVTGLEGKVSVDSKGNAGYYPSAVPEQVLGDVLVTCDGNPMCNLPVWFEAIALAPTLAPPGTPKPTVQPAACPSRYFFNVEPELAHSDSLRGAEGQPFCAGHRTFRVLRLPSRGSLTLWSSGDFRYNPAVKNDEDDFAFEMKCDDSFVCIGSAYISIRKVDHSRDTPVPGGNNGQPPVTYKNTEFQTCSGSCTADAWANSPTATSQWDIGQEQANGRAVGAVDVSWTRGTLNIYAYGKIGMLAERFPTFEKLANTTSTYRLDTAGALSAASQSSLPFDAKCLDNQAKDIGLGSEIWHASTQSLGDRYRQGSSWFHKFGGLHEQCDTFVDGCKYAPLLNPQKSQKTSDGVWAVDIKDCDVTWKGSFPYPALQHQKKSDGSQVWKTTNDRRLQATLYSEGIKPANWLSPSAGFTQETEEYKLNVKLSEWVSAHKIDTSNTGSASPFTLDAEFFEYEAAHGDRAFGLNMLFYPSATSNPLSNFAADRRVHGFRVTKQDWFTPEQSTCAVDPLQNGDEVFVASELQKMNCKEGTTPVSLMKGPVTEEGNCESEQRNVIYNRAGFSAPRGCSRNYQNLTLRGIAAGSASKAGSVDFEGSIEVQLLLSNGNRATVSVDISLFVSMLSTSGESFTDGSVSLCRSSPYFPVYDPLGTSLPDERHALSAKLSAEASPPHLCIDQLDKSFGPQGWAVIGFDVSEHSTKNLRVEQFGLRYHGSEGDIFMIYTDSITGKPAAVPSTVGSSWKETHPFLNFRDITYRAKNRTITSPSGAVMLNADFAFAFMPGSINIETDVDVFCTIAVLDETGKVTSRPTLRQKIHVDPMLTASSRNGPELIADVEDVEAPENPYFFFATSAVIIAVIALGAIAMANDKLPVGKKSSH